MKTAIALIAALLNSCVCDAQLITPRPVMTNSTVEAMVRGGIGIDAIIQAITAAPEVDFIINGYEFKVFVEAGASQRSGDRILDAMRQRLARGAPPSSNRAPVTASPIVPISQELPPAQYVARQPEPTAGPPIERVTSAGPAMSLPSSGSRVFISEMDGHLDGFLAPEFQKQKIPLIVVTQERDADFVLAGASIKEDDHWYNVVFNRGKDKNEGNVRLLNVRTKTMVWAGEAGDRTLWYGGFHRGGERKVAERIVRQMKKDLFR